jgi:hypothetical protein
MLRICNKLAYLLLILMQVGRHFYTHAIAEISHGIMSLLNFLLFLQTSLSSILFATPIHLHKGKFPVFFTLFVKLVQNGSLKSNELQ